MECSCSPLYGVGLVSRVGSSKLAGPPACKSTGEDFFHPKAVVWKKPPPHRIRPRTEPYPVARVLNLSVSLAFATFAVVACCGVKIITLEALERQIDSLRGSSSKSMLGNCVQPEKHGRRRDRGPNSYA
jgi:hypothetical protein